MKTTLHKIALWASRILSLALSLAAYSFLFELTPKTIEWDSFLLALIPGCVLLLLALLLWTFPTTGIIYIILGGVYAFLTYEKVTTLYVILVSGASIILGILSIIAFVTRSAADEVPEDNMPKPPTPVEKKPKKLTIGLSMFKKKENKKAEKMEIKPEEVKITPSPTVLPPLPPSAPKPEATSTESVLPSPSLVEESPKPSALINTLPPLPIGVNEKKKADGETVVNAPVENLLAVEQVQPADTSSFQNAILNSWEVEQPQTAAPTVPKGPGDVLSVDNDFVSATAPIELPPQPTTMTSQPSAENPYIPANNPTPQMTPPVGLTTSGNPAKQGDALQQNAASAEPGAYQNWV